MKRITTNDDIRFPISVVKGLDSDIFTIQFYTTSKAVNITKTNEDVVDGIIHLEWTELYPLGTGVMNYTVLIPEEDGSYSDDTFNKSISGTTIFYIVSNIIVPDGDDAQNLIDLVAQLDSKLDAEIARSTGKDNTHDTALADVYTKAETNTLLAGKANKNGSANETFSTRGLNLQRDGAATTLYNYVDANNKEYVSFYDRTGGSLTYQFTPNQADNIATERQVDSVSSRVTTLENAGYLTSETDPTVPAWAKAQNKPTYTASEVGALPDTTTIPSKVSDLTNDLGYVTGSKIYVGECTTAAATMPKVCTVETFPTDTNGKPLLGTVISVKFTATNTTVTSNSGLDVNGCGNAPVWYNTSVTTSNNYYGYAGRYITYMWDGTNWVWQGWSYDANSTYTNVALGQGYAVQSNSSASATITATLSSYTLTANGIVSVKFNYDVPANATLNINGKGAKAIYNKDASITAGVIKAGDTATFMYNSYYRLISVDRWQDNTGGGGSGEDNVQSDWNETDTSSDAYILNKPTVDSSITGSSQTNAVQGGAIYTALSGKAGYKQYSSKSDMDDDTNVPTGTIGFDGDEEKFYIYDSGNDEWKPIDQTGSGDGKQREIIYYSDNTESYYSTYEDRDDEINPLTYDDIKTLISDKTKEVVIDYFSALYYLFNSHLENDPFYAEVSFRSIQYPSIGDLFIEMWDGEGDDPSTMNTYLNSFQIPSSFFGICTQSGAARTVSIGDWKGRQGDLIVVKFTQDVPAGMTLNVSDTSLRNIYYRDSLITGDLIKANDKVTLLFYNNSFHVIGIDSSLSGGGDQSDGKQREVLLLGQNDNDEYIVLDQDHNELSGEEVFSLLTDRTKDVVIFDEDNSRYYSEYYFYDKELEDNYAEVNFICIVGNTYQQLFLELYMDEEVEERAYNIDVNGEVPISNISTSIAVGWTGGNSNNYTATSNSFRFVTGSIITVRFSMANIYGATLNVSNTGNKYLYYHGSRIPAGAIQGGDLVTLMVSGGGYNVMSIHRRNCNDQVAATNTVNTAAQQITFNISDYGYYCPTPYTSGNYSNYSIVFTYTAPTSTIWATNPIHTIWCEGTYFQGRQVTFPSTWIWENNDDPTAGNFSHLGDDIEAIEITVRKGKYASYKKW